MRKSFPISLFVLILLAASCKEYPCSKADLHFGLVGFSDAESDTMILRRFTKNGVSSVLKDSFLLDNIIFQRNQDTLKMVILPGSAILESTYNYEIYFPTPGKLIKVTDIREEQVYIKPRGKVGCMNRINGYILNGQSINNIVPFNITYFTR